METGHPYPPAKLLPNVDLGQQQHSSAARLRNRGLGKRRWSMVLGAFESRHHILMMWMRTMAPDCKMRGLDGRFAKRTLRSPSEESFDMDAALKRGSRNISVGLLAQSLSLANKKRAIGDRPDDRSQQSVKLAGA